jgi:hypothetical protein
MVAVPSLLWATEAVVMGVFWLALHKQEAYLCLCPTIYVPLQVLPCQPLAARQEASVEGRVVPPAGGSGGFPPLSPGACLPAHWALSTPLPLHTVLRAHPLRLQGELAFQVR